MVTEDDDNAMCLLLALVVNKIRFPFGFEDFFLLENVVFCKVTPKEKCPKK